MVHIILFSVIGLAFLAKKQGKFFQMFPFIILLVFSSLRYMYGNDYSNYSQKYNLIQIGYTFFDEAGFVWLNRVCPTFQTLIAVTSFIYIGVIYWFTTKNVPKTYICFSVFIFVISPYLFLMNLSALRQCIALMIFIIAVHMAQKRNFVLYVLLILLATQFHQSSIILLPFYFIANDKKVKKAHIFVFLVFLVLILTTSSFSSIIESFTSSLFDSSYSYYLKSDLSNSIRATLLTSVYFIYVLINIPYLEGKALTFSKLYIFSPTMAILAYRMASLSRIQMYFDIFSIVALPLIFKQNLEKGKVNISENTLGQNIYEIANRYVLPALILVIYLLRYYSFFSNSMWAPFTTYQTIFSAAF